MFPDSEIATRFQCGQTKAGYVAHFSLAPYFNDIFCSQISTCPYYAVSFDESLNDVVQKVQMDLNIWYWGNDLDQVATRYLGLEFLGRLTPQGVLETFLNGVDKLDQSKILQEASDGSSVNLLFLKSMTEFREENEYFPFVDIGTCGLYVIHVSLKRHWWGHSEAVKVNVTHFTWSSRTKGNISELLDYPFKFCGHRWVENEDCAARAETLLECITHICSLEKVSNLIAKTNFLQD